MTVKATGNCVTSLTAKGTNAADSVVLDQTVTLHSLRIYCAGQVETPSSSSENCFEEFLECMDVTEAELDTLLTESEEDNLMSDPIDCIVQAINSIHFDEPQCPILRLQNQLQAKNLKIDVLMQNHLFSRCLSRSCTENFRSLFSGIFRFYST